MCCLSVNQIYNIMSTANTMYGVIVGLYNMFCVIFCLSPGDLYNCQDNVTPVRWSIYVITHLPSDVYTSLIHTTCGNVLKTYKYKYTNKLTFKSNLCYYQ